MLKSLALTLFVGALGGLLAFYLSLPLPWLLGSLVIILFIQKMPFAPVVIEPPKIFSRWMRILLGVALGGSVAESYASFDSSIAISLAASVAFVSIVTYTGLYYFRRLPNFNSLDAFMSALPGGLTFLVSMSSELGERFPKIALVHTIRMTALVVAFSIFAFFMGAGEPSEGQQSFLAAFEFTPRIELLQVLLLALFCGWLTKKIDIPGGDIMIPLIVSAVIYSFGWVQVTMPEVFIALAMITFGAVLGFKIGKVTFAEGLPQVRASLLFTLFAIVLALVISLVLGETFEAHYFLFFLALAPGSIPEICLIAMAMGFDVGFVAMIHTCRYIFIMFIGSLGFNVITSQTNQARPPQSGRVRPKISKARLY